MSITIKNVLVETHHLIEIIERYYDSLRWVYLIIIAEILNINVEMTLQMMFKTINDSIDSNELISILLVFEAYSRMIESDASFLTITQRALIIRKIMNKIRKS
jgi:hypothetical protein